MEQTAVQVLEKKKKTNAISRTDVLQLYQHDCGMEDADSMFSFPLLRVLEGRDGFGN